VPIIDRSGFLRLPFISYAAARHRAAAAMLTVWVPRVLARL